MAALAAMTWRSAWAMSGRRSSSAEGTALGASPAVALNPSTPVDVIAHVQMGRDKRLYRLVQDTRYGRTLIAEFAMQA